MGRGTFKQKRGGGRNKHLTLDENGTAVATDRWAPRGRRTEGDDDDEDDDEEEEEEESEESEDEAPAAPSATSAQPELSRAERRELKKKKGQAKQANGEDEEEDEDEDPLLANPNIAAGKRLNISDLSAPRELSRKEREAKEKKEAQERYWKLHAQGKTDQAKSDLARLAKIRAEREAAQAKRKAEAEGQ
ncbi:hypothetical protein GY45DRAFT_122109 [Cubamyces sp. BRFM 1775]|nr:hypothetical protein GY45DRAFT_122109 [Cubamyces sp. BRFM 1775]